MGSRLGIARSLARIAALVGRLERIHTHRARLVTGAFAVAAAETVKGQTPFLSRPSRSAPHTAGHWSTTAAWHSRPIHRSRSHATSRTPVETVEVLDRCDATHLATDAIVVVDRALGRPARTIGASFLDRRSSAMSRPSDDDGHQLSQRSTGVASGWVRVLVIAQHAACSNVLQPRRCAFDYGPRKAFGRSPSIKHLQIIDTMIVWLDATWYGHVEMVRIFLIPSSIPVRSFVPRCSPFLGFASPDNKKAPGIRGLGV